MHRVLLIISALVVLLMVGCGSGSSGGTESTTVTRFKIPVKNPPIVNERELHPKPSGLVGPEPKPVIPHGPPPKNVAVADLVEGIGEYAVPGHKMTVQYVGYDYETGTKFVSSWEKGRPVTFTLGAGEVIQGWEEGLEGMEVGDRRELVVPADLTEGPYPPGIPKDKAVIFVVGSLPASSAAKAETP